MNVDKQVLQEFITQRVFPAIRAKFPSGVERIFYVLQDNARPHSKWNDLCILEEAKKGGQKIKIRNQPANSPDLNILDLGFFRSLQSLQQKKCSKNIDELVAAVEDAFDENNPITWWTLEKQQGR